MTTIDRQREFESRDGDIEEIENCTTLDSVLKEIGQEEAKEER